MNRALIGKEAEKHAENFLRQSGCKLVCRNYRCRFGEIDLIMRHNKTLVFVEVRYRSISNYGGAAASVSYSKQKRLIRTAQHYLSNQNTGQVPDCRFDVVAFEQNAAADQPVWYKDAFRVE